MAERSRPYRSGIKECEYVSNIRFQFYTDARYDFWSCSNIKYDCAKRKWFYGRFYFRPLGGSNF